MAEFYDAAVSGADPIETRAGFAALLDRIEGNGVRTVIVEDASRFARELMAQELGITLLISRGVRLLTSSGDDLTASDDPTRKMMRQIAGAFAEYEKARLVSKLRHARERVRNERGKCEGRKSHAELHPDVVAEAKRLRRASPKTGERLSYRKISARNWRHQVSSMSEAALQPERVSGQWPSNRGAERGESRMAAARISIYKNATLVTH